MYLLRANGLLYFRRGAIQRPIWLTLNLKWLYKYWTSKTAELIHNFLIANTPDYSVFASKFINVLQCSWSMRKSRGVAFATTYILTTGRSAGWVGMGWCCKWFSGTAEIHHGQHILFIDWYFKNQPHCNSGHWWDVAYWF